MTLPDFEMFFHGLWGHDLDPFPWQTMLADRVAGDRWPQALDLPTAAGKTACIDIAVYALAAQAERQPETRTAARRIWFVVDRRIVVDEAYERADAIARKLNEARDGPLRAIADRLQRLAGTDRPLAVARLRGGIFRDDRWARVPSQPAVITSTVDQLGSRILFRAYGPSQLAASIYAGLAANDSLVFLDEAHCSVPFLHTLRAVQTYRGRQWSERALATPFAFVVLSATPPPEAAPEDLFPGAERAQALDHPVLAKRLRVSKLAELVEVNGAKNTRDALVAEAVRRSADYLEADGCRRVGAMVNRVQTAEDLARALEDRVRDAADVVLLTGRIRPFERDRLVDRWAPYLRAVAPEEPSRPIVVVSTQCLEVGADFSFDALVSEAASLDALRQRFGRLDRMGAKEAAPATILARSRDLAAREPDPIYGRSLSETWGLLHDRATERQEGKATTTVVDFGSERLRETLSDLDDLTPYLAPTGDAPSLLPGHLDLLCQTAPTSHPEPDVQLYLHGTNRGAPEVQVVWRADLSPGDLDETWIETVTLCRPVSGEMLSAPLHRLQTWLACPESPDRAPDIEGLDGTTDESNGRARVVRRCLLWRGRDRSGVVADANAILPGDVVVVPAEYGIEGLGQSAPHQALGSGSLDLWEAVWGAAQRGVAVRVNRKVLQAWLACPPVTELVALAEDPVTDREAVRDRVAAVLEYVQEDDTAPPPPPSWWLDLLREARGGRIEQHPAGGLILFARGARADRGDEPDLFADEDDLTSSAAREVSLEEHTRLVQRTVGKIARLCLSEKLAAALELAAEWHDVGKLDVRFQALLRNNELDALDGEPLAKSASVPASPSRRRAVREASGLPDNFRHEMLSWQILSRELGTAGKDGSDLALHLVSSHHGHGRPLAPISEDPEPPNVSGRLGDQQIELRAEERNQLPAPHRFDSGLPERFWRLTREYGWWGLAYLEAILRLSDWYASRLALLEHPTS